MPVVLVNGVDLLHGHRVETDGVLQDAIVVKERDAHGHNVFVGVIDGLGSGDLFLLPDDLRCDAGPESAVRLQIKRGFPQNGLVGKAKILLIILADPEDDAVGIGKHHIIRQNQIIFGVYDVKQTFEVDIIVKKLGQGRCRHTHLQRQKNYSFLIIAYSEMNKKRKRSIFCGCFCQKNPGLF